MSEVKCRRQGAGGPPRVDPRSRRGVPSWPTRLASSAPRRSARRQPAHRVARAPAGGHRGPRSHLSAPTAHRARRLSDAGWGRSWAPAPAGGRAGAPAGRLHGLARDGAPAAQNHVVTLWLVDPWRLAPGAEPESVRPREEGPLGLLPRRNQPAVVGRGAPAAAARSRAPGVV